MSYTINRKDFEYLESIEPLDDWIEIQGDTLTLMQNPSKKEGSSFYERCILLWFQEAFMDGRELTKRARAIKDRVGGYNYFTPT